MAQKNIYWIVIIIILCLMALILVFNSKQLADISKNLQTEDMAGEAIWAETKSDVDTDVDIKQTSDTDNKKIQNSKG